jgi:hypothetical protein
MLGILGLMQVEHRNFYLICANMKFVFWYWKEYPDFKINNNLDKNDKKLVQVLKDTEIPYLVFQHIQHRDKQFKIFCQNVVNQKIVYFVPEECRLFLPGYLAQIYKILEVNNSTLEIWLGNFEETQGIKTVGIDLPNDRISVVNWNTFLMYESYDYYIKEHLKVSNLKIDKPYVCLNNRVTYYRCMMLDALAKHDLIKDGYVSWRKHLDDGIYEDIFEYFDNRTIFLEDKSHNFKTEHVIYEEKFFKGFVNIISEGEVLLKDLSEKTFHAILHKRPFLILGSPGIHKTLTTLGFKLFENIFDYSFDEKEKIEDRIEGIILNIKSILDKDYSLLKNQIDEILEYNFNRYIEILHDPKSIPDNIWLYGNMNDITQREKENLNFYLDLCKPFSVNLPK